MKGYIEVALQFFLVRLYVMWYVMTVQAHKVSSQDVCDENSQNSGNGTWGKLNLQNF